MTDTFSKFPSELDGPATGAFAPTANSTNTFSQPSRALYVGVAGNVHVRMLKSQSNALFQAVPAGSILPIRVDTIWDTTSTANAFVVMY